jgi:hypothetical protein
MKGLKTIWDNIKWAFIGFAIHMDESKRINEDGSWDKYHARKNRKASKKAVK